MLRAAHLTRSQPAAWNLTLVSRRWQKTPASPGTGTTASIKSTPGSTSTQYATNNPTSSFKSQTASSRPSTDGPIDRTNNPLKTSTIPPATIPPLSSKTYSSSPPPPPFSAEPIGSSGSGGAGGAIKGLVYGLALGLTATLAYAEYENGSFRRRLEATVPLSSTVLGGLDQVIDPVFGRQKKLSTQVAEKLPDLSYVKEKVAEKDPIKKLGEQVKTTTNAVRDKLPDKAQLQKAGEQVKDAVGHATDQVKGAVTAVRDALPDTKSIKTNIAHAKEQVGDAAHVVKETIKDALPSAKGQSGEPSGKVADPMFREEAGETALPPPIPQDKYKKYVCLTVSPSTPYFSSLDSARSSANCSRLYRRRWTMRSKQPASTLRT